MALAQPLLPVMKKSFLALFISLAACAAAYAAPVSYANSNAGWYAAGNLSMGMATDPDVRATGLGNGEIDTDIGMGIALAGGYEMGNFRIEGEYSFRQNAGNSANMPLLVDQSLDFRFHSFMVNVYHDFYLTDEVYWFNGFGLGVSFVKLKAPGGDDRDSVLAWQLMTGFGYDLTENIALTFGYRLFTTRDPSFNINNSIYQADTPIINSLEVGIRYNF